MVIAVVKMLMYIYHLKYLHNTNDEALHNIIIHQVATMVLRRQLHFLIFVHCLLAIKIIMPYM